MNTVLLCLNIVITLALIGTVMLQRSEGGGLGLGGGGGNSRAFMTGRGAANLLTHSTAVLAGIFMGICLLSAVINRGAAGAADKDILSNPPPAASKTVADHKKPAVSKTAPASAKKKA